MLAYSYGSIFNGNTSAKHCKMANAKMESKSENKEIWIAILENNRVSILILNSL